MSIDISPENEQFIVREIARGTFHDRTEALDAGVDLLKQRQELIDRLTESRKQLDGGEYTELNETALEQLFGDLKNRALKEANAADNGT